jgi:hypothetical protein
MIDFQMLYKIYFQSNIFISKYFKNQIYFSTNAGLIKL